MYLIGLCTSVRLSSSWGFAPREEEYGLPLLGELRWSGFAAALSSGLADHLLLVGGCEPLDPDHLAAIPPLPGEAPVVSHSGSVSAWRGGCRRGISRAAATRAGLVRRHKLPADRISVCLSDGNTGGNIAALVQMKTTGRIPPDAVLSTNFYHIPRVVIDLQAAGLGRIDVMPAEALWVAASPCPEETLDRVLAGFGDSPLGRRALGEIRGAADKLTGRYMARAR